MEPKYDFNSRVDICFIYLGYFYYSYSLIQPHFDKGASLVASNFDAICKYQFIKTGKEVPVSYLQKLKAAL